MANETIMQGLLESLMQRPQDTAQQKGTVLANLISQPNPVAAYAAYMLPGQMENVAGAARGLFGLKAPETFQTLVAQNPSLVQSSAGLTEAARRLQAAGDTNGAARLALLAQERLRTEQAEALSKQVAESEIAANQALALQRLNPQENTPAAVAEYQYAVQQGYQGTFADWKANKPSVVEEYEYAKQQGFTGNLEDWKALGAQKSLTIGAAPAGYMYTGSTDNLTLKPIPGGPADKGMSPTDAAKASMLKTATDNFNELKGMIFEYDDTGAVSGVNTKNIFNANLPGGGMPFTEGRTLNVLIKDTLEAKIRAESGAAVPTSELNRLSERFRPSILDKEDTVKRKMQLLGQFLDNASMFMKEDGTFDAAAASLAVDNALRQGQDMSSYSDDQLLKILTGG